MEMKIKMKISGRQKIFFSVYNSAFAKCYFPQLKNSHQDA